MQDSVSIIILRIHKLITTQSGLLWLQDGEGFYHLGHEPSTSQNSQITKLVLFLRTLLQKPGEEVTIVVSLPLEQVQAFYIIPHSQNICVQALQLKAEVQSQEESRLADSCESGHTIDFLVTLDEDLFQVCTSFVLDTIAAEVNQVRLEENVTSSYTASMVNKSYHKCR
ncbi:hypothetical protein F0562_030146 [Nyssa sinensis]|uniref:Uncharacterized protein n=1 Tax=Nyssa sinensis TaxID=561372 RepID=A0A5J5AW70_9ASTE|nr:hypothetical protein F0562_030146 [Nyssa sinensis]